MIPNIGQGAAGEDDSNWCDLLWCCGRSHADDVARSEIPRNEKVKPQDQSSVRLPEAIKTLRKLQSKRQELRLATRSRIRRAQQHYAATVIQEHWKRYTACRLQETGGFPLFCSRPPSSPTAQFSEQEDETSHGELLLAEIRREFRENDGRESLCRAGEKEESKYMEDSVTSGPYDEDNLEVFLENTKRAGNGKWSPVGGFSSDGSTVHDAAGTGAPIGDEQNKILVTRIPPMSESTRSMVQINESKRSTVQDEPKKGERSTTIGEELTSENDSVVGIAIAVPSRDDEVPSATEFETTPMEENQTSQQRGPHVLGNNVIIPMIADYSPPVRGWADSIFRKSEETPRATWQRSIHLEHSGFRVVEAPLVGVRSSGTHATAVETEMSFSESSRESCSKLQEAGSQSKMSPSQDKTVGVVNKAIPHKFVHRKGGKLMKELATMSKTMPTRTPQPDAILVVNSADVSPIVAKIQEPPKKMSPLQSTLAICPASSAVTSGVSISTLDTRKSSIRAFVRKCVLKVILGQRVVLAAQISNAACSESQTVLLLMQGQSGPSPSAVPTERNSQSSGNIPLLKPIENAQSLRRVLQYATSHFIGQADISQFIQCYIDSGTSGALVGLEFSNGPTETNRDQSHKSISSSLVKKSRSDSPDRKGCIEAPPKEANPKMSESAMQTMESTEIAKTSNRGKSYIEGSSAPLLSTPPSLTLILPSVTYPHVDSPEDTHENALLQAPELNSPLSGGIKVILGGTHSTRQLPAPQSIFPGETTTGDVSVKGNLTADPKKSRSWLSIFIAMILISGSVVIYRMRIQVFTVSTAPVLKDDTKEISDPFDYVWLEEL